MHRQREHSPKYIFKPSSSKNGAANLAKEKKNFMKGVY
jgi:hypothetical protein